MHTPWIRFVKTLAVASAVVGAGWMLTDRLSAQGGGRGNSARDVVGGRETTANEVLVKFTREQTADERAQTAGIVDADQDEDLTANGVRRLHSRRFDTAALVSFFRGAPNVEYAEPNYIVYATNTTPNDPSFPSLWGLLNTGQVIGGQTGTPGADIDAAPAWDITTGSAANVVGVVDTGIDYNHPDLAANVWTATSSFTINFGGRKNTLNCSAGTHGIRSINNVKSCNPLDDNAHGTHTSGTIGARGNNNVGVAGVNWTASIMGLKFLNSGGSGTTADAVNVIEAAIQLKQQGRANVRVLSNSWGGGGFSQTLSDEITKANTNGMLFVAAAGNNGFDNDASPFYPASYTAPNVVAVAATDNQDGIASFSNFGSTTVDLGAPGVNILSTTPNNTYSFFSGTSMATPHVAGAAALILAACPSLNTAALKTTILNTVDPISSLSGKTVTGGRLNVKNAIFSCSGPPTPDFSIAASPSSRTITNGQGTTYSVTVTAINSFAGDIALSVTGLPAGTTNGFSPQPITGGAGSSTLTITTDGTTPTGTFPLTITGTSGALVHTTGVTLVVNPAPVPDFSIAATPSSRTITKGQGTTYSVTVTAINSFAGDVALSVTGLPAGTTNGFSPQPITGGAGSSTLTITTDGTTPTGTFPLTITGTSGALVHTTGVTLVVNPAPVPDFSIAATPSSRTITKGQGTTYSVTVTAINSFVGDVALSVTGLPAGTTNGFSPQPITGGAGSSTLTITTDGTTPTGTFPLTITGTSGALVHTTGVTLVVNPAPVPDFSIAATPSSRTITKGQGTTYSVTVTAINSFVGDVALSVTGLPVGTTNGFSPQPITGGAGSSTLTITTDGTTPTGTFPLTITGTSGALVHTTGVTLVVNPVAVPDFSISASPSSRSILRGQQTTYTVTIGSINGFSGNVTLSVTGLPANTTNGFNPQPVSGGAGSSTLTITTTGSTPTGTFPLTITGTSGGLVHSSNVTLVVFGGIGGD